MDVPDTGASANPLSRHEIGLRFVRRMYLPRAVGLGLGALAIGAVLYENQTHVLAWLALALSAFAWPHAAYLIGRASRDPFRAELNSLMVDSALGGAWIALMHFNLLPSVLLAVMLSMDKLAVGGGRLLARCAAAMLAACAAAALAFGFELRPQTSMLEIAGALPLFILYPMLVGITTYRLARRVRDQNRELAEISRTDGLSGLLNRRYWDEAVAAEFQRCRRSGRTATILMLDIDHFKDVNDRHGHPAGDAVIRSLAMLLRGSMRQQDVPGRYGGEEFGIVLPETSAPGASVIAERLRKLVGASVLEPGTRIRCTVSIGLAQFDLRDSSYGEWISHADRALYAAKARGRNRIEGFEREEAAGAAAPLASA